jgi:hypothetical protein
MEDIEQKWSDILYLERNVKDFYVQHTVFRGELNQYKKEMFVIFSVESVGSAPIAGRIDC